MAHLSLGRIARLSLVAPLMIVAAPPARAGIGDLLVAPTRVVLNGRRGTEVILNNIGDDVATYRVTAELRRMTPEGKLVEVTDANAAEKAAQEMVLFAPRKDICHVYFRDVLEANYWNCGYRRFINWICVIRSI